MSVIKDDAAYSAMLGHTVLGRQRSRQDADFFLPEAPEQRMFVEFKMF